MRVALGLCTVAVMLGCARPAPPAVAPDVSRGSVSESVWALDLVLTRPGQQAEYLRGIRANWAAARRLVAERGDVRSYHAFTATPDSARGWDVVLLTEYRDSSAFARREATFQQIFRDPRYVAGRVVSALPSEQLRTIILGAELTSVVRSVP